MNDKQEMAPSSPVLGGRVEEIRKREVAATKGPWTVDRVTNDGDYGSGEDVQSGFDSFQVCEDDGRVVVDTLNSTTAVIEDDGDDARDVVGEKNTVFIAHARDDIPFLLSELSRLQRGDFTAEEFQNLCHNLPDSSDAKDFFDGCAAYQKKLFGDCDRERLQRAADEAVRAREAAEKVIRDLKERNRIGGQFQERCSELAAESAERRAQLEAAEKVIENIRKAMDVRRLDIDAGVDVDVAQHNALVRIRAALAPAETKEARHE